MSKIAAECAEKRTGARELRRVQVVPERESPLVAEASVALHGVPPPLTAAITCALGRRTDV